MNNLVIIGHPDKNSFCHNGIFKTISKILDDHPNQKLQTVDLYEDKLHRDKKELIEKYNNSSTRPKDKQKIKNELVRRGGVIFE